MQQCRELRGELHAAMEELHAGFRARLEKLKELPREERDAAMRALKQEYEQAKRRLHAEFESKREQCKDLKERADEHQGEAKARP